MDIIKTLHWRYAVKKYSNRKISSHSIEKITEAINLSASSTGLQPYRVIVVENAELRKQLGEGSFNAQIKDASHLLVFAAFENVTEREIDEYLQRVADVRQVPLESLNDFRTVMIANFLTRSQEDNFNWASRQAYIGLGTALIAAAEMEIDTTPMEGFDAARFDTLLGLKEKGLRSVVLLALGYRDETQDPFVKLKKVRLPLEEFASAVI